MPTIKHNITYAGLRRPVIFAHRGSSAHAPENTLAAFRLAVEQNATVVELDAKLSADGQVVVIHDDTVDRTTDGTGGVGSMTLSELKRLDAGIKFSPEFKTERIPTLAEVFEAVGDQIVVNVEMKNVTSPIDDLPDKVVSLIQAYGLEKKVILSSFNPIALIRARYRLPEVPMGYLTITGFAKMVLLSGLVRFGPYLALHPAAEDVTPELIQSAHRMSCRIHAYKVFQPDQMQRLFKLGVDGIFTDDPPLAQQMLASIWEDHDLQQQNS
jgi:glycerophosphoryl diester phosphodiesterase